MDLRAEAQQDHLKVMRWQVASKDLTLDLKLDIHFATEFADSTLDGCLRFKPSSSLEQRNPKSAAVIATTGASRGPDGIYSIEIEAASASAGSSARRAPDGLVPEGRSTAAASRS